MQSYIVRERKQGFWRSVVAPMHEVYDEGDGAKPVVVATGGGFGASGLKPQLTLSSTSDGTSTVYRAESFGGGSYDGLSSCLISEEATEVKVCLVVPLARTQGGDPKMTDSERGYPVFFSTGEGASRRLVASDGTTAVAEIHRAWKDSDRKSGVVGKFQISVDLDASGRQRALLAAPAEILHDLDPPPSVTSSH